MIKLKKSQCDKKKLHKKNKTNIIFKEQNTIHR